MRNLRWAFLLLLLVPHISDARQSTLSERIEPDVLARMKSAQWTERSEAFRKAVTLVASGRESAETVEKLRLGLIELLVTETAASRDPSTIVRDEEREGYSNYSGNLIGAVADLKDARAIPALLGVADTGGMATRGLAHFGKTALDPVLKQVNDKDPQLAEGALFVIRDMLEYRTVRDNDSRARRKNALQSALARPNMFIRESTIYAIEYLDDREKFVQTLTEVAKSDPFKLQGQVATDGQDNGAVYPVRRMARVLLAKIANHEAPIVDRGVPAP